MFTYDMRIPKERIAVLIGTNGQAKNELEKATKTSIEVDSTEGDVSISGEDAILLYSCRQIVKAISRGFNPEVAIQLLKQDYSFELIDLNDYARTKNSQQRLKGRVIGTGGKSRRVLEELTDSSICVYGKTIGIIAPSDTIGISKNAVQSILEGSKHSSVFKMLEKKQRDIKIGRTMGSFTE